MLDPMIRRGLGVALISATALELAACAPKATSGGFESANPAARMYAIEQAARDGDRTAVRSIVEELDSDDPAVRFMAIEALERLTGTTRGYRHYDPPAMREQAIRRWVTAVEADPTLTDEPEMPQEHQQ